MSFPSLVGSKEYADVVFHVGNHALYAHRCVVEARCPPLFAVAIKDRGKKGHLTTLKADEKLVDMRSLTLILEYLYTGSVPFTEVTPAEVISLIAHAEMYQIDRLRWLCDRYLQAVLNTDLFFTLLLLADVSGVASAKELCLNYGSVHFEELIVKKEQVHTLGIELFREFVVHSTLNSEMVPDLNQQSFPNTIKEEFKIIFTAMANPDAFFTFKAANTTVPCHKAILYAQSERFKTLFLEDGPSASENRYSLPKNISMSHEAFRSFLSWAYYRDTSFSAAHAAMMLPLAHDFNIVSLIDECSSKLRKGISIESVLPILNLCFSEWGKQGGYKEELSKPCLSFLMLHFAHVDLTGLKSAAITAAIAKSVREAVVTGLWNTIATAQSSSAPSGTGDDEEGSIASPHEESSAAESSSIPTSLSATSLAAAASSNNAESGDDRKSARKKKRKTMAVDPADLAVLEPTSPKTDSESPPTPKEPADKTHHEAEKPATTNEEVSAPKEDSKSPKTKREKKDEAKPTAAAVVEPKAEVAPVVAAPVVAVPVVVEETTEKKDTTPAAKPVEEVKPSSTVEEVPPVAAAPIVVVAAEEKPVEKAPEAEEKKPKEEVKAPEPVVAEPVAEKKATNGEVAAPTPAKSPKSPKPESKSSKSPKPETKLEASSSASSLSSSEKHSASEKPAATEKPSDKTPSSSKSDKKLTTEERRANLEPSTSVKVIKETFEAKGREEQETQDKLRAGRRQHSGGPSTNNAPKKDGKSK